nr:MAG TPA: hypothetical protein [Caudoviricetes sp.]
MRDRKKDILKEIRSKNVPASLNILESFKRMDENDRNIKEARKRLWRMRGK